MIHYIQMHILQTLLYSKTAKFSDLKPKEIESNLFTFHLNKSVDKGLVEQNKEKQYLLTPKGKEFANRFDIDSDYSAKQAKHSVIMCGTRKNRNEVLFYTRKKHPFYDFQGFPTGKVKLGESIIATAEREMLEETGLKGQGQLVGIRHYRVYDKESRNLLEDKVLYIIEIADPEGELIGDPIEGEYVWLNIEQIDNYVIKPFPGLNEVVQSVLNFDGNISFKEEKHYPEGF